jgi:hypothetical protein
MRMAGFDPNDRVDALNWETFTNLTSEARETIMVLLLKRIARNTDPDARDTPTV